MPTPRARAAAVVLLCIPALGGCASVKHAWRPVHPAGTALPVEVVVGHDEDQPVSGTVHYRVSGTGPYGSATMQLRADRLWAILPTEQVAANQVVEYYVDVERDGKLIALGSPATPYLVRLLDEGGMILARLRERAQASDDRQPVTLVLEARGQPVGQPVAIYRMPGVPGDIRAPMEADASGDFLLHIPARAVRAGTWNFAVEVPVLGRICRLPARGYRSFVVTPWTPPRHDHETASAEK